MNGFERVCRDIKEVKTQGAVNIAIAAVKALELKNDKSSVNKLISLRPTEPTLRNAIDYALRNGTRETVKKLIKDELVVGHYGAKLIKDESIVYTHCHSSTVIKVFEEAVKQGKSFVVNNTETRPLFQGRLTSLDLARLGVENYFFVDSAMRQAIKYSDIVMLGADSVTPQSVINKIGSELASETASRFKKPVYICSTSWKFDPQSLFSSETPIEYRNPSEIWKGAPKNVQITNPAFEKINPKLIKAVVCEWGILTFKKFLARAVKEFSK